MKKTYLYLLVSLRILFLTSCDSNNAKYYANKLKEFEVEVIADTISGTPLLERKFIEPMGIETVDDYLLVIENSKSDRIFSVIGLKEDSVVARFGQIGHARNEFSWAPTTCYFGKEKGNIMMYVAELSKKIKVVNLSKSIQEENCVVSQLIEHGEDTERYFYISKKKNIISQYITYEDPRDHIYLPPKYILKDNNKNQEFTFYPSIISCPNLDLITTIYNSEMRFCPNNNKIVEGLLYMNFINIVDVNGLKTIGVVEKDALRFEDVERHQNDPKWMENNIKACTRSMSVTEHYIMVLQDSRILKETAIEEVNNNRRLLIFNQDGDYLNCVCIADKIDNIAYSEFTKQLYGINQQGTILKYNLSQILK